MVWRVVVWRTFRPWGYISVKDETFVTPLLSPTYSCANRALSNRSVSPIVCRSRLDAMQLLTALVRCWCNSLSRFPKSRRCTKTLFCTHWKAHRHINVFPVCRYFTGERCESWKKKWESDTCENLRILCFLFPQCDLLSKNLLGSSGIRKGSEVAGTDWKIKQINYFSKEKEKERKHTKTN